MKKTYIKKNIGKSISKRNGNYRVEYFKVDKKSNIGSVGIGCYIDASQYSTVGSVLRHLNSTFKHSIHNNSMLSDIKHIWVPDLKDKIIVNPTFCSFTIQFELDGLGRQLDEVIYEVVEDQIIEVLELCNFDIINK